MSNSEFPGLSLWPARLRYDKGLWHPSHETSSCGIGFVADLTGTPSHRIVVKGLEAVSCLTHRGAVAADSKTGDGAGLLTQIPHKLLHKSLGRGQGKLLKKPEDLAVAMLFCPRDAVARHAAYAICEEVIGESDLFLLTRREVPVDMGALGAIAAESCPEIRQLLLMRGEGMSDEEFERTCYVLRKRIEARIVAGGHRRLLHSVVFQQNHHLQRFGYRAAIVQVLRGFAKSRLRIGDCALSPALFDQHVSDVVFGATDARSGAQRRN